MMMVNKKRRNFCQDWVKLAAGNLIIYKWIMKEQELTMATWP